MIIFQIKKKVISFCMTIFRIKKEVIPFRITSN